MVAESLEGLRSLTIPISMRGLGRVAVLDDDPECLHLARTALACAGFEVDAFERLASLLDSLEKALPDAIVLDRRFPGGSGEMLSAQLRSLLGRHRPPIVIWTADSSREAEAAMLSAFASDVVIKCEQGVEVLVQRVINLVGWEYMAPGLLLNAKGGFVLFRGQRSHPLTGREVDFLYALGMAGKGGLSRAQGKLMLLDPTDDSPGDLQINRVVSRLLKKLPEGLRGVFVTMRGQGWRLDL